MLQDHLVQKRGHMDYFFGWDCNSFRPLRKVVCQSDAVSIATATDRKLNQIGEFPCQQASAFYNQL